MKLYQATTWRSTNQKRINVPLFYDVELDVCTSRMMTFGKKRTGMMSGTMMIGKLKIQPIIGGCRF